MGARRSLGAPPPPTTILRSDITNGGVTSVVFASPEGILAG